MEWRDPRRRPQSRFPCEWPGERSRADRRPFHRRLDRRGLAIFGHRHASALSRDLFDKRCSSEHDGSHAARGFPVVDHVRTTDPGTRAQRSAMVASRGRFGLFDRSAASCTRTQPSSRAQQCGGAFGDLDCDLPPRNRRSLFARSALPNQVAQRLDDCGSQKRGNFDRIRTNRSAPPVPLGKLERAVPKSIVVGRGWHRREYQQSICVLRTTRHGLVQLGRNQSNICGTHGLGRLLGPVATTHGKLAASDVAPPTPLCRRRLAARKTAGSFGDRRMADLAEWRRGYREHGPRPKGATHFFGLLCGNRPARLLAIMRRQWGTADLPQCSPSSRATLISLTRYTKISDR